MTHVPAWRTAVSAPRALMIAGITVLAPVLAMMAIPAHARSAPDTVAGRQATVHFGDLDLASSAGRHRLEMRLERSARTVCDRDGDRSLAAYAASRDCYNTAIAHAHTALAAVLDKTRLAGR